MSLRARRTLIPHRKCQGPMQNGTITSPTSRRAFTARKRLLPGSFNCLCLCCPTFSRSRTTVEEVFTLSGTPFTLRLSRICVVECRLEVFPLSVFTPTAVFAVPIRSPQYSHSRKQLKSPSFTFTSPVSGLRARCVLCISQPAKTPETSPRFRRKTP
jgi:hypothetical protein